MNNTIYTPLYEIANENMQQSGNEFTHPRPTFLNYAKNVLHSLVFLVIIRQSGVCASIFVGYWIVLIQLTISLSTSGEMVSSICP